MTGTSPDRDKSQGKMYISGGVMLRVGVGKI
jgi:hypothetical protein